jgi:hypothetical protein
MSTAYFTPTGNTNSDVAILLNHLRTSQLNYCDIEREFQHLHAKGIIDGIDLFLDYGENNPSFQNATESLSKMTKTILDQIANYSQEELERMVYSIAEDVSKKIEQLYKDSELGRNFLPAKELYTAILAESLLHCHNHSPREKENQYVNFCIKVFGKEKPKQPTT